jgi:hypothetical protein
MPTKRIVWLVHGFLNDPAHRDPQINRLKPGLETAGFEVWRYDPGFLELAGVRLCNKGISYGLMRWSKFTASLGYTNYVVAHSNGCEIVREATLPWNVNGVEFPGAKFDRVVLLNPALNNDAVFGPDINRIYVYHNPYDWVVEASQLLLFHPWGNMGRVGYKGTDKRFTNREVDKPDLMAHNVIFDPATVATATQFVAIDLLGMAD